MNSAKTFYERAYQGSTYAPRNTADSHPFYEPLKQFVETYELEDKRCLEIGTGRGAFQSLVGDYNGLDIAVSAAQYLHKPFTVASAGAISFASATFDAIWTINVLEHVPYPERVLAEMWRVLKPGGYLFLLAAWQCRPWAANGYPVRPYSDFDWKGKLVKASIPLRDSVAYRAINMFPRRVGHLMAYKLNRAPTHFRYRQLAANFETYWMSDSDAVNSMDPFEAYLWYVTRNGQCLNYRSLKKALFVRNGPLIFEK